MGVGSILGVFSFLGFALFIAGIGIVVLSVSQGRTVRRGVLLAGVGLVVGLLFSVVSQGILIVQPQEIAVVFNTLNGDLSTPLGPGTHVIVPVIQQYTIYGTFQREYTMSGSTNEGARTGNDAVRARTVDGQEVSMDVTILYSVDPAQINTLHQRWQTRFEENLVRPTARSIVRDVLSQFRAEQIYGEGRGVMENGIQTALQTRMEEEGLVLTDLLVRDINFSVLFTEAIEQAQIAEQDAERARLRVQQIQQEAEQARAEAQGSRDAAILRAEGVAQATVLQAQAQAEALRLVSEQIAANPSLIQYEYIQNLSDNVGLVLVPSNSPFLFDLASLPAAIENFTAPEVPGTDEINLPQAELTPEPTPTPGS
jgi:prohibitin 2